MCSFIAVNREVSDEELEKANVFSKRRGPDYTNVYRSGSIAILHNLLHITGEKTIQPVIKDEWACVFNGEIYGYKELGDYKNECECILDAYKNDVVFGLDGEYCGVLINLETGFNWPFFDDFGTKPLWETDDPLLRNSYASYKSSLETLGYKNIKKIGPLTHDIDDFDLNQHKNTYDDWIEAFENAIRKRTQNTQMDIFTGMSSGYDSGPIAFEMEKQGVRFKVYSIRGDENIEVLEGRHKLLNNGEIIHLTQKQYNDNKEWLDKNCEDFEYTDKYGHYNLKADKAIPGLAEICKRARKEDRKIYISGQGADEIMSDYAINGKKRYKHSEFSGIFPNDLSVIYPWHSFYDGTQIKFLNKEEYIAGAYGVETRYPFLDKQLVQEYLWLSPKLKNAHYKAPLREYMKINNIPFEEDKKKGFAANANLL